MQNQGLLQNTRFCGSPPFFLLKERLLLSEDRLPEGRPHKKKVADRRSVDTDQRVAFQEFSGKDHSSGFIGIVFDSK